MAIWRCGNPTPSLDTWRPAMISVVCGPQTRPRARASIAGWTGRSRRFSPIFFRGFSGAYTAPRNRRPGGLAPRRIVRRCASLFRLLDEVLAARPSLAGDSFSLADIPAGTSLYRYFELDIE